MYDNGTNGDVTAGDNIWSRDVTFPQYSPLRIQYKYGANWGLASNGGGNDNENGVGADHFINLTSDLVSATVENVFGTMGDHQLVNVVTDVRELQNGTPATYELSQNYPNPFNNNTKINYQLMENSNVTIAIYNGTGQLVRTLVNEEKLAGNYNTFWDGKDGKENVVTSGIYICQLKANNYQRIRRLVFLK